MERFTPALADTATKGADVEDKDGGRGRANTQARQAFLNRRISDYEIRGEIARGGMGVVYRARQISLDRMVAVKVLLASHFVNDTFIKRFRREAEAAASLNHPNIVAIHEVGEHEGQPYFSMELVEGCNLADLTREKPLPAREAAQLLKTIAEAVQFAHGRGLLHRDLKPSNVVVDAFNAPHITDFGLAKRVDDADLTLTGQVLGTPNYMPPEQADPKRGPTTVGSDVYSLGAILYQLLTGRAPFMAETLTQTLRLVTDNDAVSPRLLSPSVPRDLETICARCLEKDPKRRYASAQELAEELGRFLNHEPIRARPISTPARVIRWCRRKPALASALTAGALLLLVIAIGSPIAIIRINAARDREAGLRARAQSAERDQAHGRERAEAQELAARKKAYASDMKLLQHALAADDLGRAQELLNRQRPLPGEKDLRGWEWRYLWQFCQSDEAFTLGKHPSSVSSVSFSSDGALLAAGGVFPNQVAIWNVTDRRPLFRVGESNNSIAKVAFAPKQDILAFYENRERSIVLCDSRSGAETHRLPVDALVRDIAFTRDGKLFAATAKSSNNITVWDVRGGSLVTNYSAGVHIHMPGNVFAVTADGRRQAWVTAASPGFVQIRNTNDALTSAFRAANEVVTTLAFSPDGQTLITAGGWAESSIKLWNVETHQLIGFLEGHRSYVSCLKFLPDGKTLISSSADRTVRLWDFETRRLIRTLRGHSGELWTLDVSPDGQWLASGGKDGSVILWDLTSSASRPPPYRTLSARVLGWWGYSPDGRWIAAIQDKRLKLYDATTLQLAGEPALTLTSVSGFAFSPDTRLLLATDSEGNLGVWDIPAERMVTNFVAHNSAAGIAPDFLWNGRSALSLDYTGVFKEWNVATWQLLREGTVGDEVLHWGWCGTANLIAVQSREGLCHLIPVHDPDKRRRLVGDPRVRSLRLSPDGQTLAGASENGTVEIWDTATLQRRAMLGGVLLGYHSLAFSPDGDRLAAGSNGQEAIKMWDTHSYEEVATLVGEGSLFKVAAFSPDGNTIGARNLNGVLHLWSAPSWEQIESAEKPRGAVLP